MVKLKIWADKNLQGDRVIWAVVFALLVAACDSGGDGDESQESGPVEIGRASCRERVLDHV